MCPNRIERYVRRGVVESGRGASEVWRTGLFGGDFPLASVFRWTEKANVAALSLAQGETQVEAAEKSGVTSRTLRNWLAIPEFAEEVDRLTFLTGVASKAERLRMAKRVIVKLGINTNKDLLEWLKFAQSETDGIKLDFAGLYAALHADDAPVAGSGQGGDGAAADGGQET